MHLYGYALYHRLDTANIDDVVARLLALTRLPAFAACPPLPSTTEPDAHDEAWRPSERLSRALFAIAVDVIGLRRPVGVTVIGGEPCSRRPFGSPYLMACLIRPPLLVHRRAEPHVFLCPPYPPPSLSILRDPDFCNVLAM